MSIVLWYTWEPPRSATGAPAGGGAGFEPGARPGRLYALNPGGAYVYTVRCLALAYDPGEDRPTLQRHLLLPLANLRRGWPSDFSEPGTERGAGRRRLEKGQGR
jgi:hypothetical protein